MPRILGGGAVALALANLGVLAAPEVMARAEAARLIVPAGSRHVAHLLSAPAAMLLLVLAVGIVRRRRAAADLAMVLLVGLAGLSLVRGLDVEQAVGALALAGALWWSRDAFYVLPEGGPPLRDAVVALPILAAGAYAAALAVVLAVRPTTLPAADLDSAAEEAAALLNLRPGDLSFGLHLGWIPTMFHLVGIGVVAGAARVVLRPRPLMPSRSSTAARALVEAHGADTLSFFKLRTDLAHHFSPDGAAFVGYRLEGRTLLVSGDPIGPVEAIPGLLRDLFQHAERHGLTVAVVGASGALLDVYREAGLRAVYIGDEAIVRTADFHLEGRSIRKVRQSVSRLTRAGYRAEVTTLGEMDPGDVGLLARCAAQWRGTDPERGFSMAMDRLGGEVQRDSVVVVARDADGAVRGFLHFVPCPGRSAMSLNLMRRDRRTPNGLTEFLVVAGITELRGRGITDLSLNFAAFARLLHSPSGPAERLAARALRLGDRWFQIERLLRFNAKFTPHWEPRYLLCDGLASLPRAAHAALAAEGFAPRPPWWRAPAPHAAPRPSGSPEVGVF